ncbi:MAG: hypothetical protein ACK4WC_00070 [Rubrimonas sp.]
MPLNQQAGIFTRLFRWTTLLQSGQPWRREDADRHADDMVAAFNTVIGWARRKTIPLADLSPTGFPFEVVVTLDPDGNRSMREWRLGQWVTTRIMQPNGSVVVIENPGGEVVDVTPPPIPSGWSATPFSTGVILSGAPSPVQDFAAFILYEGASGAAFLDCVEVDRSRSTTIVMPGMAIGVTRSFYLTAVDFSGNESGPTARIDAAPTGMLENGVVVPIDQIDGLGTAAAADIGIDPDDVPTVSLADTLYAAIGHGHAAATTSDPGFMSSSDKTKLNGIAAGAQVNPTTTAARNNTSTTIVLQAKAMADHLAQGVDDHPNLTPRARAIAAAGLASGGGDLTADRTITVTAATNAQGVAGTATNVAMTPASTAAAIDARAFGADYAYFNVTREGGVWYQNTTGRLMFVNLSGWSSSTTATRTVQVSATPSDTPAPQNVGIFADANSQRSSVSFFVPAGHYYRVNGGANFTSACEFRVT